MKSDQLALQKMAKQGDRRALAKLLTLVEDDFTQALKALMSPPSKGCQRIGVTGPPGAGKSTLVSALLDYWKGQGQRIAVLAVDPSSPFSGGAVLGDRLRMAEHFTDERIFIRSLSSRGKGGGIAAATGAMARILELSGFDIILIETVGVGQTELDIMNLVDLTVVVLVPESGDVVQTMKAGILEIADCFVVNKSDRSGAEALAHELGDLSEGEAEKRAVFLTAAHVKKGTDELAKRLEKLLKTVSPGRRQKRAQGELRSLLLWQAHRKIETLTKKLNVKDPYQSFLELRSKI